MIKQAILIATLALATSSYATNVAQLCEAGGATLSIALDDQTITNGQPAAPHYAYDFTAGYTPGLPDRVYLFFDYCNSGNNHCNHFEMSGDVMNNHLVMRGDGTLPAVTPPAKGQYPNVLRVRAGSGRGCDLSAVSLTNVN